MLLRRHHRDTVVHTLTFRWLARPAIPRDEGVYPARVARIGGPVPLDHVLALVRLVEHNRHPLRVVSLGWRRELGGSSDPVHDEERCFIAIDHRRSQPREVVVAELARQFAREILHLRPRDLVILAPLERPDKVGESDDQRAVRL